MLRYFLRTRHNAYYNVIVLAGVNNKISTMIIKDNVFPMVAPKLLLNLCPKITDGTKNMIV